MSDFVCSLKSGETGIIDQRIYCKRLADLGFVPGHPVEMICAGNPCILRINGATFGVGQEYQCNIPISCKYCTKKHE